jgi:hypothetical protein
MISESVRGVLPRLPAWLANSRWWTQPIRAERLAALRIGVGLVLLLDVLGTYVPRYADFFGRNSLTAPGTATQTASWFEWHRLALDQISSPGVWAALFVAWAASALFLALGLAARLAAAVAWFFSASLMTLNPALHNGGDQVRTILLFFLILCPCGAVWSVDAWQRRSGAAGPHRPVFVHPWPLRLLFLQLVTIYFMNGMFKLLGAHWRNGQALSYLLGDVGWTRWSFAGWPLPEGLLSLMTWTVLAWEIGFPIFMLMPALRKPALLMGILFHVGTGLTMRLGPFPLYMLCMYLPLVQWETWTGAGDGTKHGS